MVPCHEQRLDDPRPTGAGALLWCLLGFLALGLPPGRVCADTAANGIQVTARVLPHVRLEPVEPPTPVTITAADVQRGYVDVIRRYAVRTNAPDRMYLQIHPRVGYTSAIDISGLGASLRLIDTSLEVAAPRVDALELSFRFWLEPAVGPGDYPLPLHLVAAVR